MSPGGFARGGGKYLKLTDRGEENTEVMLTDFRLPLAHRKNMNSTNMQERLGDQVTRLCGANVSQCRDLSAARPMSIGPLIAVRCQDTILSLPLSSDTPVAIAPSELVRLRRRSDRGWRDDCLVL
ncbi:hypothetical protein FXB38_42505 [Bradyrhizobium cytisi]|uniref:Uncharacterized protein n=1 Tax=Bradyrhizobium cytisi TaxID=515489 RepID=A0A5S4VV50_9BRAD|nr:hypothetical protein FXB38_42505 [Bradyrhizobium cytisi]